MTISVQSILVVTAAAAAAPLLAQAIGRWLAVPIVVYEILLGFLVGPDMAGWVSTGPLLEFFGSLGLAMLFLLAGYEIDFSRIRGRPLRLAGAGWLFSLAIGVGLGIAVGPTAAAGVMVGICLTSTALGTIMPALRDAGQLQTRLGVAVLAIGAVGEFGPLIAMAVFLSGRNPAHEASLLVAFAAVIVVALIVAVRFEQTPVHRLIESSLRTSGQFAVRLVILLLAAFTGLARVFGLDMLLGAFAAGVLIKLLLRSTDPAAVEVVEAKLEAVGFGFLVPIFFINTGVTFDLEALVHDTRSLVLVPVFVLLFVVLRGLPASIAAPRGSGPRDRFAIALFGATGLPIIVAVTTIGLDDGELHTATAAALVGAGMLSVLLLPLLGLRLLARG